MQGCVRAHYNWTEVANDAISAATRVAAESPFDNDMSPHSGLQALKQILYLQTAVVYG